MAVRWLGSKSRYRPLHISELDFSYPLESIARNALPAGQSRVLRIDRKQKQFQEINWNSFFELFSPGDLIIFNDSRVLPARLEAAKSTGGKLEVFFLRETQKMEWEVLIRGSVKVGNEIVLAGKLKALIFSQEGKFTRIKILGFLDGCGTEFNAFAFLKANGTVPLPPYIVAARESAKEQIVQSTDRERYQTQWAANDGSVAAPTAGLHFGPEQLKKWEQMGVDIGHVTLHVGAGTFLPLDTEVVEEFKIHSEWIELDSKLVEKILRAKKDGKKVWACGTTALRALESWARQEVSDGRLPNGPYVGETQLFVTPGFDFKVVDGLLTNFHQPRSSLLALAMAFAGEPELIRKAYAHAIEQKFRLFSFGDLTVLQ